MTEQARRWAARLTAACAIAFLAAAPALAQPRSTGLSQDKIDELTKVCAVYLDKRLARES